MAYTPRHFRGYPLLVAVGFLLFISMLMTGGCNFESWRQEDSDIREYTPDAQSPSVFLTLDVLAEYHAERSDADIDRDYTPGAAAPGDNDVSEHDVSTQNATSTSADTDNEPSDIELPDAKSSTTPDTSALPQEGDKTSYYTMSNGYTLSYPTEWKFYGQSDEKFVLTTQKIVEPGTAQMPDKMRVTVTYFDKPDNETFDEWFGKFPKGSEKVLFNNVFYSFVAEDTEGPFGRTYYQDIYAAGVLKLEFLFEPGYAIPLEEDSAGWKTYLDASMQYRQELWNQFLQMLESIKEDV